MISKLFRPQFLSVRLMARSGGGWERPDPPAMVPYENRRTLGLVNMFLHRNDGVAPAYIINDYSLEATLTERYANFFKNSFSFFLVLVPFFFFGWFFLGNRVPEFVDAGALDIKKRHKKWVEEGLYEKIKKENPYGLETSDDIPHNFVYSATNQKRNDKHDIVRQQGQNYIQRLISEVKHDMENQSHDGHNDHNHSHESDSH